MNKEKFVIEIKIGDYIETHLIEAEDEGDAECIAEYALSETAGQMTEYSTRPFDELLDAGKELSEDWG